MARYFPGFNIVVRISILILSFGMVGCAQKKAIALVTRPAEIDLQGRDQIAIGGIEGDGGQDLADDLTQALFSSGRFQVLDRQHLEAVMQEHDFTESGLADPSTSLEFGKLTGASIVVFGRVADKHFNETLDKQRYEGGDGRIGYSYTRYGEAIIRTTLQVTDLQTGRILSTKTTEGVAKDSIRQDDSPPAHIDPTGLYTECRRKIVEEFMKSIAPYQESLEVEFERDRNLPGVQSGISQAQIGNWDAAYRTFKSVLSAAQSDPKLATSPGVIAKAGYNVGVAATHCRIYNEAIDTLERAYTLSPKPLYAEALDHAKRLAAESHDLKSQGVLP